MRRRKKHRRFRGRRTYHGSHKKWRGGGSRGGRGRAGMHKHKWSYTVKYEPDHFGKRGFATRKVGKKTINLGELWSIIEANREKFEKDGMLRVNLVELGYDKLLGRGSVPEAMIVEAREVSKKAREKIESVGGQVVKV